MEQAEWYECMIEHLFSTKANFNRQRRSIKVVYNGKTAFVKFHGLSAVAAKPKWDALSREEKGYWAAEAMRLNAEALGWQFSTVFLD